jgi:hypothetical protein
VPIVTDGLVMEPERGIHEYQAGYGTSLGATAAEAWSDSPLSQLATSGEIANASGQVPDFGEIGTGFETPGFAKSAGPRLDIAAARERVKQEGLEKQLHLPDQPDIPEAQLAIMMRHARERSEREATIARGPQGFVPSALQVGTSFLVGAVDPINIAAGFVPVLGELRYGKLLASAGESALGRAAIRAGVGAAQGAVGQAALEPLDWWAHTQEGRDFGMSDVLHNIMFGAALGGGLHAAGGFAADVYRGARGRPLYPFGLGEAPPDLDAIAAESLRRNAEPFDPSPEIATIHDLPPRTHEDAMRTAIAALVNGEPVRAGDVLEAAAAADPRIAESFEAQPRVSAPSAQARQEVSDKLQPVLDRPEEIAERRAGRVPPASAENLAGVITKEVRKTARGRAAADPTTWSLYEFLAHEGGLRPDQELEAIFGNRKGPFVPGFGALVRPKGRTLDDAVRLAKDHGYLFDAADVTGEEGRVTIRDLLDRIAEENAGRKQYRHDQVLMTKAKDTAALEREKHEIIRLLHDEIETVMGETGKIDPALEDRVVEIMTREGETDVLSAYDRAIMEDAQRYEGQSHERQQHSETADIPGWDLPPESGGASLHGEADQGQRGQAGIPDEGASGADGVQPRVNGPGDRGPGSDETLDQAAAWRGLAAQRPDFDDLDIVAASNAAAKVEPPKTKLDECVTAAEKAEAYARQMYDLFAHRLPEQERAQLDELIADLDRRKADFDMVTQRGAACLFEASTL